MIKKIILEILDYLRFQVENDKCTMEELQSIYDAVAKEVRIDATVGDIARHYGQSESNVCNAIARSYTGKPRRRVYYNLMEFLKCIPKRWGRR